MASMLLKIFIFIFLIFISPNSGGAHGLSPRDNPKVEPNPHGQKIIGKWKMMRKILGMEEMLMDYHEPGANPSHEPRKGSPGGRASINP